MMNIPADKIAKRTSGESKLVRGGLLAHQTSAAGARTTQMPPPADRIAVRS